MEEEKVKVVEFLKQRTKKSWEAYQKAKEVIPAGVLSRGRLYPPYPFFVKEAKGPRLIDLDGNEYVDCATTYGASILGHIPPVVVEAVQEAIKRGSNYAMPHEEGYKFAELVVKCVPCAEKVTFCNSGTESTLHAIRIARAYTGKDLIAKFEGGYHGDHDYVLASCFSHSRGSIEDPETVHDSIGIPQDTLKNTITLPFNHPAAFEKIKKYRDKLAVVMIEGLQGAGGCISARKEFLEELRKVTNQYGVLLLFDEVFTGFRLALGGAQEFFGVVPDMATYGKILGGGLPCGGIAGTNEVMETINYTGDHEFDSKTKAHYGGTFNGNLLSIAAGKATLQYLMEHPQTYEYINAQGARIREEINQFCKENKIPAQAIGEGSIFYTHFVKGEIVRSRDLERVNREAQTYFFLNLLKHGVFIPFMHLGMISASHTEEDIDFVIEAHKKALLDVKKMGLV